MSRATGVDIITGAGLDAALNKVEVIVDAATGPSPGQQPATEFFLTAAHNLQEAGVRAGVRRADVATSEGDPAEITEIARPHEEDLAQLATMLVARRGTPVKVLLVRNPAAPDAGTQATGGLLPGPGARLADPTFEEWLDQQ